MRTERTPDREPLPDHAEGPATKVPQPSVERRDLVDREVALPRNELQADEYGETGMRLLPDEVVDDLRPRWADIQASFVDEPRRAVEQADQLVADAIGRLSEAFAQARSNLEHEWDRGEEVSTEDLRLALRRYRTFFDRLLDV